MEDEEGKQNAQSQGPLSPGGTGQTVHLAPSSGIGSTGGGAGSLPASGGGGQFATLQNYVDANQGQAAPLAGKITSGVQNQFNTLQGQNQSTLQGLQGQVQGGYTPQDQGLLASEASNPVSFASNPSNISSFQKQLNDQYTGPTSAEGSGAFQNQQAKVNQAISTGNNLAGSEPERHQILTSVEKAPSASVTGLNEAILSQDPKAFGSIENAYKPFSGLNDQLSAGAADINKNIAQGQSQAQGASSQANSQIASQNKALQDNLNANLANMTTQGQQYQQGVTNANQTAETAIQNAVNTFEKGVEKDSLGRPVINPNSWNSIGMGAFGPGATYNTALPTMAQAATPDQYAMGSALSQLGGTNPLSGMTNSAYNPLATNPSLKDIVGPEINPLETFMSQYFGAMSPNGAPQGSQFGAGSPTESNVLPFEQAFVQPQYQNLMNTINTYTAG